MTFTCNVCGRGYRPTNTFEEMRAEAIGKWDDENVQNGLVIGCDDCFKRYCEEHDDDLDGHR